MTKDIRVSVLIAMFALTLSAGTVSFDQSFVADSGNALTKIEAIAYFPANTQITALDALPAGWSTNYVAPTYAVASGPSTVNPFFHLAATADNATQIQFDLFGFSGSEIVEFTHFQFTNNVLTAGYGWDKTNGSEIGLTQGMVWMIRQTDLPAAATATPEPATLGLIGSSLLGLGVWGRRRMRS